MYGNAPKYSRTLKCRKGQQESEVTHSNQSLSEMKLSVFETASCINQKRGLTFKVQWCNKSLKYGHANLHDCTNIVSVTRVRVAYQLAATC